MTPARRGGTVPGRVVIEHVAPVVDAGRFPVERGYALDEDDGIRRVVITTLMCNGRLDIDEVERRFGLRFDQYFAAELAELTAPESPQADGLVRVGPALIEVTPLGRTFVRNICMVFDRYLRARNSGSKPVFSRTV